MPSIFLFDDYPEARDHDSSQHQCDPDGAEKVRRVLEKLDRRACRNRRQIAYIRGILAGTSDTGHQETRYEEVRCEEARNEDSGHEESGPEHTWYEEATYDDTGDEDTAHKGLLQAGQGKQGKKGERGQTVSTHSIVVLR